MSHENHPFANLFPLHDGEKIVDLVEDIGAYGLRTPIILYNGQVLDGRRRLLACKAAGIDPTFKNFTGDDRAALAYVVSMNLPRRHLSDTEKALAAAEIATMKRGYNMPTTEKKISQQEAANMMGVNLGHVERAARVLRDGTEKVQEAVKDETISLHDAVTVTSQPPDVQDMAIEAVREGKASTAARAVDQIKRDRAGKEWPAHLLPLLEWNAELNQFRKTVAKLIEDVNRLASSPLSNHIEWAALALYLEKVRKACIQGKVDYLCPYCEGALRVNGLICKQCKGSGFLPQNIWDDSPAAIAAGEMKEIEV